MPEVERPEFRKDAKPTERSYGKNVVRGKGCAFEKVVGMERVGVMREARKARTLCGARDCYPFAMVVGMERVDATGGASKARMP